MAKYGWLGCALFFITSGYLNAKEIRNRYKTMISQIFRLIPLYYLSLVFWLSIKNFSFQKIDIIKYLTFTFNLIHSVAWFCAVLIQIYITYFLIIKKFENKKYFLSLSIIFLQIITLFLTFNFHPQPTLTKSILVYLPCFLSGILIKQKKYKELIFTFVISTLLMIFGLYFQIKHTYLLEYVITNIIFALFVLKEINIKPFFKNIINKIAQSSYSIYLFNYIFIFFPKIEHNILNTIANFSIVILLGLAIETLLDKNLIKIKQYMLDKKALSNTME